MVFNCFSLLTTFSEAGRGIINTGQDVIIPKVGRKTLRHELGLVGKLSSVLLQNRQNIPEIKKDLTGFFSDCIFVCPYCK